MLVRSDSAGASHGFVGAMSERGLEVWEGFDLAEPMREAILQLPGFGAMRWLAPAASWAAVCTQFCTQGGGRARRTSIQLDTTGPPSRSQIGTERHNLTHHDRWPNRALDPPFERSNPSAPALDPISGVAWPTTGGLGLDPDYSHFHCRERLRWTLAAREAYSTFEDQVSWTRGRGAGGCRVAFVRRPHQRGGHPAVPSRSRAITS